MRPDSVQNVTLGRRLVAELVGTALLAAIVVGSGILAQQLSVDGGLRLLENSIATGAGLVALVLTFGSVSGARFNPLVTASAVLDGRLSASEGIRESAAQIMGGILGAVLANAMYGLSAVQWSTHQRSAGALWLGEIVATFGLLTVIFGVSRSNRPDFAAFAVGGYIAAAYWFTSSTSFANPAVTIARMFSNTFAGIRPPSALAFIAAQCAGAALAIAVDRYLHPKDTTS